MAQHKKKPAPKAPPQMTKNDMVKLAFLGLIIISIVALLTSFIFIGKLKAQITQLEQNGQNLQREIKELQKYISNKGTDEGIKDVAEDKLDLVDPDTIIYDFE